MEKTRRQLIPRQKVSTLREHLILVVQSTQGVHHIEKALFEMNVQLST